MEYKDIKIGDVVECNVISEKKGIVINKNSPNIFLINKSGKTYSVKPQECDRVIRTVNIKAILEAIID